MRFHSNVPIINHNGDEMPLYKAFQDIFIPYVGGDTSYKYHMKDFLWRHGEQVLDALEVNAMLLAACKSAVAAFEIEVPSGNETIALLKAAIQKAEQEAGE